MYFNDELTRLIAYYVWESSVAKGEEKTPFDCWLMALGYVGTMQYLRPYQP